VKPSNEAASGKVGRLATDLVKYALRARLLTAASDRSADDPSWSRQLGRIMSPWVGRRVPVTVGGRTGSATLRADTGRSREKRYYFDVVWDVARDEGARPAPAAGPDPDRGSGSEESAPANPREIDETTNSGPDPSEDGNDLHW